MSKWIIDKEDESVKCPVCKNEFYYWGIPVESIENGISLPTCPICGTDMKGNSNDKSTENN